MGAPNHQPGTSEFEQRREDSTDMSGVTKVLSKDPGSQEANLNTLNRRLTGTLERALPVPEFQTTAAETLIGSKGQQGQTKAERHQKRSGFSD